MAAFEALVFPLRIAQGVLTIIILGLMAYDVNSWNDVGFYNWSPSEANFLLFCSIWTILVLAYLIIAPLRFQFAAHKFGILAAEAVTAIFWFSGFIAFSVLLGHAHCGNWWGPCRAGEAAAVFAAFEWILFTITTVMAALHAFRSGSRQTKHDPAIEVHPQV